METVRVDITGLGDVKRVADNLAEKIENPDGQLLRRIGDATMDDIEERFMTRGHGAWPPLAESTIARKKGNSMVLIDTGAMFASLRPEILGRSVRVVVPYGGAKHDRSVPGRHQQGGKNLPQRKIVDFTPTLARSVQNTVVRWLVDMIKAKAKKV